MAQLLAWDATGTKQFQTGVDHCVLYPMDTNGTYPEGFAWNGITNITKSPSGAESTPLYADNTKYLNLLSAEELSLTLGAYMYPEAFEECDGSKEAVLGVKFGQQDRKTFGLCWRTLLGNDVLGQSLGYKLHLVYGCTAAPSEQAFQTVNDSPEAIEFSWEINTTPVTISGYKPFVSIEIVSTEANATKLAAFEAILYGATGTPDVKARLPLPSEVLTLMAPGT